MIELPGGKQPIRIQVLVGTAKVNILRFDLLGGRTWHLPNGPVWSFAHWPKGMFPQTPKAESPNLSLLEISIPLPPSRITNVKQYPLPTAALKGIDVIVKDLEQRGIIARIHSPYNSPIWPVKKKQTETGD